MHFRLLGLIILLSSTFAIAAPGRAPAVEDFVGIEVEQVEATPKMNENLYNLEQDVVKIETARSAGPVEVASKTKMEAQVSPSWSLGSVLGMAVILVLPLVSWIFMMNHLRNKASAETASNIEVLAKYRQEREQVRGKDEEIKKVS